MIWSEGLDEQDRFTVFGYRTDLECPYATWVAATTVDEVKTVIWEFQLFEPEH